MNASSVDIVEMLEEDSSSLGLTYGVNLFIGLMPSTPKNVVCVYDSVGFAPDAALEGVSFYQPGLQIKVRNTDYLVGKALVDDIMENLHARNNETWNGTLYMSIMSLGDPAFLGQNESHLFIFSLNFNIRRR